MQPLTLIEGKGAGSLSVNELTSHWDPLSLMWSWWGTSRRVGGEDTLQVNKWRILRLIKTAEKTRGGATVYISFSLDLCDEQVNDYFSATHLFSLTIFGYTSVITAARAKEVSMPFPVVTRCTCIILTLTGKSRRRRWIGDRVPAA